MTAPSDELIFEKGMELEFEVSAPGYENASIVYVVRKRKNLAQVYLKQRHLSLSEISFLLGYSELSAFSRAVRRWTGESPRVLRGQIADD